MTKTHSFLLTASLLAFATPVHADTLPKPIADLEAFVGTWKATGTATMGKDVAKVAATWTCKRTSAKNGVLCMLKLTGIPGMAAYEETDLFGYEPNSNAYHWFSVTNAGETHDHIAKVPDGKTFQFTYTGMQEAKPFKEVIDLELGKDGKSMTLKSETFVANASTSVLEVTAKK